MKEVRTTPDADLQILEIDAWWLANRDKAPGLFVDELAAAFTLIGNQPASGRAYDHPSLPSRRVLLRKCRFHVYYVELDDHVLVVAVWGAVRGHGPDLGSLPY